MSKHYTLDVEPAEYKVALTVTIDDARSTIEEFHNIGHVKIPTETIAYTVGTAIGNKKPKIRDAAVSAEQIRELLQKQLEELEERQSLALDLEYAPGFGLRDWLSHFVTGKFYETLFNTHRDAVERYNEALVAGPVAGARIRRLMVYEEIFRCCFAGLIGYALSKLKISAGGRAE